MIRKVIGSALCAALLASTLGAAAGFLVSSGLVQGGSDSLICDPSGVTIDYLMNGPTVTAIQVNGIDFPSCSSLQVKVDTDATDPPAEWISVSGSSHVFNIPDVLGTSITSITVMITGADN
ncbi:MAG TPA: hypothetical protein VJB57_16940 [Dehalococcoidia bacterium]|nr:hypothetical protein [Dehalococcoidia bacterium]